MNYYATLLFPCKPEPARNKIVDLFLANNINDLMIFMILSAVITVINRNILKLIAVLFTCLFLLPIYALKSQEVENN